MAAFWGVDTSTQHDSNSQDFTRTGSTKKNLSDEAINSLIYDIMSSDQGLAALATGENASGGYKSSTKSLASQDLIAKIFGQLANVTAETVTSETGQSSSRQNSNKSSGKVGTVICTELARLGYLDPRLVILGMPIFAKTHRFIVSGYHAWSLPIVPRLAGSKILRAIFIPLARGRYEQYILGKKSIEGYLAIYGVESICFLIGAVLSLKEKLHGRSVHA
jgi:hypothetical protein